MYIKGLELSEEDRGEMVRIVKKGLDWHMRERAQMLLYFDSGWEAKAIAAQQELHLDAVYDRRKHWLAKIATAPLSGEARICLLYRGESKRWLMKEMKANLDVVDEMRLRLGGEPRWNAGEEKPGSVIQKTISA